MGLPQEAARCAADAFEEFQAPAPVSVAWFEESADIWFLEVLFSALPDRSQIDACLAAALAGQVPAYTLCPLEQRDWVAQSLEGLTPVCAGRFVVHGAHHRALVRAGAIGIEIEAGQAFGTGHHATTLGCLLALQHVARQARPRNVLDLGTGTGVLAIAAAKLARCPVVATDIDPIATQTARTNVRANQVAPQITCLTANGVADRAIRANRPYDLVMANILARPLVKIAPTLALVLARRGAIILSGLLIEQRAEVLNAYRARGYFPVRRFVIGEWATLLLRAGP
ncbi:MAG: 50S ribosomal protein L11 methyltransferase [Alphaproteobacteria bacterium]